MTVLDFDEAYAAAEEEARAGAREEEKMGAGPADTPWPEPSELPGAEPPIPFPVDALPRSVAAAVREYHDYGQQPLAMIVASALGAMSLAVQGLVDVARDKHLIGPASLFLLVVAESGERKTAVDRAFAEAAEAWLRDWQRRNSRFLREASAARKAHESQTQGILAAIREASKGTKKSKGPPDDVEALKQKLKRHAANMPPPVPAPRPFVTDATIEGVANVLVHHWPTIAWTSNEGGTVVGGHALRDDRLMSGLAFLNTRWDGAALDRNRSGEEPRLVNGRRMTTMLMIQPQVMVAFLEAGDGLVRAIGALARFLLCAPESTAGTRFRKPQDRQRELPALARFLARARDLHEQPLPMSLKLTDEGFEAGVDENGNPVADQLELYPTLLQLNDEAGFLWCDYYNEVEAQLAPHGELATVKDIAAKSADNAARLAAIFHVWENGTPGVIDGPTMERAAAVAKWFLYEARRVLAPGNGIAAGTVAHAELLARWVGAQKKPPTAREVQQRGPYVLRNRSVRDAAISLLQEHHWLRIRKEGRSEILELNPAIQVDPADEGQA